MNRRRILWALGLSLGLGLLWAWRAQVATRRAADARLFFSYLDGPLQDYALSATRAKPMVLGGLGDWSEAAEAAARSNAELAPILKSAPEGWIRARLLFVAPLHERWAAMAARRPQGAAQSKAWLEEERELRRKLVYMLEDVRYEAFKIWKLPQDRFLEWNALIYSLKELDSKST